VTVRRIKVGLVGLGEVAQVTHLPVLEQMRERYEVAAICDISPTLLEVVGDRYGVANRYLSFEDLAEQSDLDAVFVLNSNEYHADATVAAARRGKHVLVEKPMCITMAEADAIERARDDGGVHVMVAYMRRHAPAFVEAVQEIARLDRILYARVRDIIGPNRYFIDQAVHVVRPTDFPAAALEDRAARWTRSVVEAIGDVPDDLRVLYRTLLGLSSHDLSVMREAIGFPRRVVGAAQWNGGRFLTAILEYDGFNTLFETGLHTIGRFDAHLEVYGQTRSVRVQYDTPYIRHLPTTLHLTETVGERHVETTIRPTFTDPYTHELIAFHEVVTENRRPKTPPEDYREDLRLFRMLIDAVRPGTTTS
jgi:predicted dehydrogenase